MDVIRTRRVILGTILWSPPPATPKEKRKMQKEVTGILLFVRDVRPFVELVGEEETRTRVLRELDEMEGVVEEAMEFLGRC